MLKERPFLLLSFCIHVNYPFLFSDILSFFFYYHLENNGPYSVILMNILKLFKITFSVKHNKIYMYLDSFLYKMNILTCFSSYYHPTSSFPSS